MKKIIGAAFLLSLASLAAAEEKPSIVGLRARAEPDVAKGTSASQQTAYGARRGSWNRSAFIGCDVLAVPFANGRPSAAPQAFLTGFVANERKGEVYGRPVSVQTRDDGAVFVVADAGDTVRLVRRNS